MGGNSNLAAFLDTMYKKRALEYKAAFDQSQADVAGAEAIGGGIASIGGAIGSIGQGVGQAVGRVQTDQIATQLASESGQPLTASSGMLGGAATEFNLRQKMGQLGANAMTPYQQATIGLNLAEENRKRQAGLYAREKAAEKDASKTYKDSVANADSYQASTTANMEKLYAATSPDQFSVFQAHQKSLNVGARKAGIPEDQIQPVPQEYIPPAPMNQETAQPVTGYQRYPQPSYAPGVGTVNQRTTGIPQGAIPHPGFQGQKGATSKIYGKPHVWDGNFWVPSQ